MKSTKIRTTSKIEKLLQSWATERERVRRRDFKRHWTEWQSSSSSLILLQRQFSVHRHLNPGKRKYCTCGTDFEIDHDVGVTTFKRRYFYISWFCFKIRTRPASNLPGEPWTDTWGPFWYPEWQSGRSQQRARRGTLSCQSSHPEKQVKPGYKRVWEDPIMSKKFPIFVTSLSMTFRREESS